MRYAKTDLFAINPHPSRQEDRMAHNLNQLADGSYAYLGKDAGWHGLGTVLNRAFTWAEVRQHPGLDFEVFKQQLYSPFDGSPLPIWVLVKDTPDADGKVVIFETPVKKTFETISHHRLGEVMDPLIGARDGAHYITAGALGVGDTVFAAADLGLCVRVGDDVQKNFLMGLCRYGTGANDWRTVNERPVCRNTVNIAMSEATQQKLRIAHRTGANAKVDKVAEALWSLEGEAKTLEEKFNFLASKAMPNTKSVMDYLNRLFPLEEGKESSKPRNDKIIAILERLEKNDGKAFPEQYMSAYAMYQATTGALQHDFATQDEAARARSNMFGEASQVKEKALEIILETAEGLPANKAWMMRTQYVPASTASSSSLDDIIASTPSH
jgi:phage/plasmid-like protein (TIGR03299 family)